jgi:hypothetical protein
MLGAIVEGKKLDSDAGGWIAGCELCAAFDQRSGPEIETFVNKDDEILVCFV